MIDVVEILIHWYAGRSQHELSTSLGVDRKTARKYLAPAVAAGLAPGGPPMSEQDWRGLVCEWFPELADARLRQVSWPVIEPHRDYVATQLKAGVTAATVAQRLVDEHGLTVSVASLRRWVRANLPEDARRGAVTVLRDTPPPGQEAQIDYGQLGMWLDPRTGRRRTVWAFVMVLAHSRHMFVRPTLSMEQAEWTAAHVEAFAFFGGVPARLVPDNLKTGVDKPDLYDPKINRSYAELAAHYGVLVDPARVFKPKDKARVERPIALCARLVLARPGVHLAGGHAHRRRRLEQRRGRPTGVSPAGGGGPGGGVRRGRGGGAGTAAGGAVRTGHLVGGQGRPGHPPVD